MTTLELTTTPNHHDMTAQSSAARSTALVQAKFIVAIQRPRVWDVVRAGILKDCRRTSFAREARYLKPVGDGFEGWSIRFVEAALAWMGNVDTTIETVYDDEGRRIYSVCVTDLERNVSHTASVTIAKTVERRYAKGRQVLSERTNSEGKTTFTVVATEDELGGKAAALCSKALRTCGLRHIPGDLLDEALRAVLSTRSADTPQDPDADRKKLIDAFGTFGVGPAALSNYLGHPVDQVQPKELDDLRGIYIAIKDGELDWPTVMEARTEERETKDTHVAKVESEKKAAIASIRNQRKKATKKDAPEPEADGPPKAKQLIRFWKAVKATGEADGVLSWLSDQYGTKDPATLTEEQLADAIASLEADVA